MSKIHQLLSYLSYWLNEESEHSLHAPFVYDLYQKVLKKDYPKVKSASKIESIRKQFIKSEKSISIEDFGSGKETRPKERKISQIASDGISRKKYSQFFDVLIEYLEADEIIELGTSLGINSLYLANDKNRSLTTFEGASALCAIAEAVFTGNDKSNIKLIEGDIDVTLPNHLKKIDHFDLVFVDANHQYQPTINYFEWLMEKKHDKSCFIFDDIHRSKEMEMAWSKINESYEVTLSIDLFQVGLVFVNPELRKQSYILSF